MQLQIIQQKIYDIRGHRVMLDFDLAELYEVETRILNQAVKRNTDRFPDDFMFQLSEHEFTKIKAQMALNTAEINSSQIVMSYPKNRGIKYTPYAFTEHGVTMLASVLRSEKAIEHCNCKGIYCVEGNSFAV